MVFRFSFFVLFIFSFFAYECNAADYYWVGNSGNWSDFSMHWATNSGGSQMHTSSPTISDNVFFDENSFNSSSTIILDEDIMYCKNFDFSGITNSMTITGDISKEFYVSGSWLSNVSFTNIYNGKLIFTSASTSSILSSNVSFNGEVNFNGVGSWFLQDDFHVNNQLKITQGSLATGELITLDGFIDTSLVITSSMHLVPSEYSTIQLAVDAAADGDTIYLSNGIYTENISYSGKEFFLLGESRNNTIINRSTGYGMQNGIFNITCTKFWMNGFKPRTLYAGTADIIITGYDTAFNFSPVNLFLYDQLATFNFSNLSTDTVRFFSSGITDTISNVIVSGAIILFEDNSAINNLITTSGTHLIIDESDTLFANTANIDGSCSQISVLSSSSYDSIAYFKVSGGHTINYNSLRAISTLSGTYTAINSFDNGGNIGWTISEQPSNGNVYWIGGTGNWSDSLNWSTRCIPGPNDTVIFDDNSFSSPNQIVTLDVNGFAAAVKWENTAAIKSPDFAGSNTTLKLKKELTLNTPMTASFSGTILLAGTDNGEINSCGVQINADLVHSGTGLWNFSCDYLSTKGIDIQSGSIDFGIHNYNIEYLSSSASNARVIDLSSSTINLTGIENILELESTGLTLNTTSSKLICSNQINSNPSRIISEGQFFDTLEINNLSTHIYGSNNYKFINIMGGSELLVEGGSQISTDSIFINSSCDSIVRIGAINTNSPNPPKILKTGFNILDLDYVEINHLDAQVVSGETYNLTNSSLHNSTLNWSTTPLAAGTNFYWRQNGGNWGDVNNWESPVGVQATCLPTINDTVYFDNNSFSSSNEIVNIDVPASAKIIYTAGSEVFSPKFNLSKSLNIGKDFILENGITITSDGDYPEIKFIPSGNINGNFTTNGNSIGANITIDGETENDTITLNGTLNMLNSNVLKVSRGSFKSSNDSIFVGKLDLSSTTDLNLNFGSSYIEVYEEINTSGVYLSGLSNSKIHFGEGCSNAVFNSRDANATSFNLIKLYGSSSSIITLNGDFNVNTLEIEKGSIIQVEENKTLSINNSLIANGECETDTIFIKSKGSGTFFINCINSAELKVCNLTGLNASGALIKVLFGFDNGSNTNVSFLSTEPANVNFSRNYQTCLDDLAIFSNNSTDYLGGNDLTYLWSFGDDSTSTDINPSHDYLEGGKYYVDLTAYYSNGCFSIYSDSININDASIFFSSDAVDSTTCMGDSVKFYVSSPGATNYNFYLNTNSFLNGNDTICYLTNLVNEDSVRVQVTLNGCLKFSDALPFTVNDLPVVNLTSSDSDNIICEGELVTFTASGADNYVFLLDGEDINYYSANPVLAIDTINDTEIFGVRGKNLATTCYSESVTTLTMTVNPNPVPLVTTTDLDLVICDGEQVEFNATGSDEYEFFIDGISKQGPSTNANFLTTQIGNGQVVTTEGTSIGCTVLSADSTSWFVNPNPSLLLTNSSTNDTICDGDEIQFSVSGASLYEFYNNASIVQSSSGSSSFSTSTLNNGDVISVSGTQSGCSSLVLSNSMTVLATPNVNLFCSDADVSICSNEQVVFSAVGADNYSFLVDGVIAYGPTVDNVYISDSITNGQTVSVTGSTNGCESTGLTDFNFAVEPPISLNFNYLTNRDTICEGEMISFSGYGFGVTQYDLEVSNAILSTTLNGNFNVTLPSGNNTIKLIGNRNGCSEYANDVFSVYVIPLPTVNLYSSDNDNIICDNETVIISASGAQNYEFFVDGFTQGISSSTDSLFFDNLQNGQTVTVTGTENGCSSPSLISYTFTVNASPVVLLSSDDIDGIICQSDNVIFTATGANEYSFSLGSNLISGFSALNTYQTDSISNNEFVIVTGKSNDCFGKDSISLVVNDLPLPRLTLTDLDTTSCAGDLVTINCSGASLYEFFIDNVSSGPAAVTSYFSSSSLLNGQVITMIGTSTNGCSNNAQDTIAYNISPLPDVNVLVSSASNIICSGDTISFNSSGADSINYFLNGNFISNQFSYNTDSLTNGDIITISGFTNGCSKYADSSYQFTVYNYPITTILTTDLDSTICDGDSFEVIGYGAIEYEFFISGISQGQTPMDTLLINGLTNGAVINVLGHNYNCSSPSGNINVLVNDIPNVNLTSSDPDNTICFGELVTFTASGASDYNFYSNTSLLSSSQNTLSLSEIEQEDTIYAIGYNGDCSSSSDSIHFLVNKMDLSISSNSNNMICQGSQVIFTALGADQYEFFIDGISVQSLSTNNSYTSSNFSNSQVLTFNGYNSSTNCTQLSDDQQLMVVLNSPSINPTGPIDLCQGDSVVFISDYTNFNQWQLNSVDISSENTSSYTAFNSGSYNTTITLGGDYEIESFGSNTYGQLGNSNFLSSIINQSVEGISGVLELNSGRYFNVALDSINNLYAWGKNDFGQLGDSTYGSKNTPVLILNQVSNFDAGDRFTVALKNNGTVFSWGENSHGQLGLGDTITRNHPLIIQTISGIQDVKAGAAHAIALDQNGKIFSWGDNQYGQLGTGDLINRKNPTQINISGIAKIAIGSHHCFAIDSNGVLWAWGDNSMGQLGTGDNINKIVPTEINLPNVDLVDGGLDHSVAKLSNGKLYSWGNNQNGQLGTGNNLNSLIPVLVSSVGLITNVKAGYNNTFLSRSDNSLWSFGRNTNGQLGDQTFNDSNNPLHIYNLTGSVDYGLGYSHSSVLSTSKTSCPSNSVDVSVLPASEVFVIVVDSIFYASQTGDSYQWFLNGNPIFVDGNTQSFVPTIPGYYSVEVTYSNGCSVTSNIYPFNIVGLAHNSSDIFVNLYPNPFLTEFHISTNINLPYTIELFNNIGQTISYRTITSSEINVFMNNLKTGMYFLKLSNENFTKVLKVKKI